MYSPVSQLGSSQKVSPIKTVQVFLLSPFETHVFFATILDFLVPKAHNSRRLCGYNVHKCSLTFTSVIGKFQITVLKMSYKNCNARIIQDWLHTEKDNILFYHVI
jgi:hypothetical protein